MVRTTIDIDDPVLRDLKRLQRKADKSLGRLVSDLLVVALKENEKNLPPPPSFEWLAPPGELVIDLLDKDAVWRAMEDPEKTT